MVAVILNGLHRLQAYKTVGDNTVYTKPASIFELVFDILWHITHTNCAPRLYYDSEQCYFFVSYNNISSSVPSRTPWSSNYPGMPLYKLQDNIANKRFIDYLVDYDEVKF